MHGAGTPFVSTGRHPQNAKLHMVCLASCSICASSTRYAPRDFISAATSNMMRVTGRCKSDLVTSPHQRVVGLGPRQQPTADTPGVAPAKGTDQSLYSDCSGMCRLRREGLAASSCFKVLYPYFGWLGIPERFEDRLRVVALATLSV